MLTIRVFGEKLYPKDNFFVDGNIAGGWDETYYVQVNLETGEVRAERWGTIELICKGTFEGFLRYQRPFMFRDMENHKDKHLSFKTVINSFTPTDPEVEAKWKTLTKKELIRMLIEKGTIEAYETDYTTLAKEEIEELISATK